MKKNKFLPIAIILLGLINTGCQNKNTLENNKNITIGTSMKLEKATRDEYNYDTLSSGISELPLVSKNTDGTFSPLLVDYTTSDSKIWTLTLNDNYRWSDGNNVTAEDILFSLEYEWDNNTPLFSNSNEKGEFETYSISEDNKSISLTLEKANIKYLDNLTTFRIRPKHIYNNKNIDEITVSDARVSCGPYILNNFSLETNSLVFTKNPYYPKETKFKKITYILFNNEEMLYNSLNQNSVDFIWNYSIGIPTSYQSILSQNDNIKFASITASNCPAILLFNNKKGFGSDKNIRAAISYALNYQDFKKYFGSEFASTPNKSFAPSSLTGYKETEHLVTDYSIADEYMKKAGYIKEDTTYKKQGVEACLNLTINSKKETHISYGEFVKTQLEKFGIKVNLDTVDSTLFNEKTSHKFATEGPDGFNEITMEAAIMGFTAYGMKNLGGMYINGNNNVQGGGEVYNEELDNIMNSMESSKTIEEYMIYTGQLQDFYANELPAIALFWDNTIYAYSKNLKNVHIDSVFGLNNYKNFIEMIKE